MPIPFRDADEVATLGAAGFLRLLRAEDGGALAGALLLVDARAEPLELVHHWIALPGGALWSENQQWRHGARRIIIELFSAAGQTPLILLALRDEMPLGLLGPELTVPLPVALVDSSAGRSAADRIAWVDGPPAALSPAGRLFEQLTTREMLIEPFGRAARVLQDLHGPMPYGAAGQG